MRSEEPRPTPHDPPTDQAEPDDDCVSPVLARLERSPRRPSPIRRILEAPVEPAAPDAERLAALEAQVARLEHQQRALADNLAEAHRAFTLLAERVDRLEDAPAPRPPEQPPDTPPEREGPCPYCGGELRGRVGRHPGRDIPVHVQCFQDVREETVARLRALGALRPPS